jgi:hypothetical protein
VEVIVGDAVTSDVGVSVGRLVGVLVGHHGRGVLVGITRVGHRVGRGVLVGGRVGVGDGGGK